MWCGVENCIEEEDVDDVGVGLCIGLGGGLRVFLFIDGILGGMFIFMIWWCSWNYFYEDDGLVI